MDSGFKMMATLGAVLGAGALLVASVALVSAGGESPAETSEGAAATATTKAIDVELVDIAIKPKSIEVAPNTTLEITVKNTGQIPHDLKLGNTGTKLLNSGETEKVKFGPFTKDTQLICDVPGHAVAGMTLDVKVTGAEASHGATTGAAAGTSQAVAS
ncbi:MAG: hypothetical protein EPO16_06800, partial [Dehalococcoidia bacterium]